MDSENEPPDTSNIINTSLKRDNQDEVAKNDSFDSQLEQSQYPRQPTSKCFKSSESQTQDEPPGKRVKSSESQTQDEPPLERFKSSERLTQDYSSTAIPVAENLLKQTVKLLDNCNLSNSQNDVLSVNLKLLGQIWCQANGYNGGTYLFQFERLEQEDKDSFYYLVGLLYLKGYIVSENLRKNPIENSVEREIENYFKNILKKSTEELKGSSMELRKTRILQYVYTILQKDETNQKFRSKNCMDLINLSRNSLDHYHDQFLKETPTYSNKSKFYFPLCRKEKGIVLGSKEAEYWVWNTIMKDIGLGEKLMKSIKTIKGVEQKMISSIEKIKNNYKELIEYVKKLDDKELEVIDLIKSQLNEVEEYTGLVECIGKHQPIANYKLNGWVYDAWDVVNIAKHQEYILDTCVDISGGKVDLTELALQLSFYAEEIGREYFKFLPENQVHKHITRCQGNLISGRNLNQVVRHTGKPKTQYVVGNSCYYNELLQFLYHSYLLPPKQRGKLHDKSLKAKLDQKSTRILSTLQKKISGNAQNNAAKLLLSVTDILGHELGPESPLSKLAQGSIAIETNCHICLKRQVVDRESFTHLQLSLPNNMDKCTLKECWDSNLGDTLFTEFTCNVCGQIGNLTHQITLPDYLIIILKRFGNGKQGSNKNKTFVQAPLQAWVPVNDGPSYDLVATLDHIEESLEFGHYMANCLQEKSYLLNDTKAQPKFSASVPSRNNYILLYKRCSQG